MIDASPPQAIDKQPQAEYKIFKYIKYSFCKYTYT